MPVLPFEPRPVSPRARRDRQVPIKVTSSSVAAPPELPTLRVNLSPEYARRTLAALALIVTLAAAIGTVVDLALGNGRVGTLHAWVGLEGTGGISAWLLSLPWLFLAVVLFGVWRMEWQLSRPSARGWVFVGLLSLVVGAITGSAGALADALNTWTRAALLGLPSAAALLAWSRRDGDHVRLAQVQILGGLFGGIAAAARPFHLLGLALLPGQLPGAALEALLVAGDALLGLGCTMLAVQAALVYVRDTLPAFAVALDMRETEETWDDSRRVKHL